MLFKIFKTNPPRTSEVHNYTEEPDYAVNTSTVRVDKKPYQRKAGYWE